MAKNTSPNTDGLTPNPAPKPVIKQAAKSAPKPLNLKSTPAITVVESPVASTTTQPAAKFKLNKRILWRSIIGAVVAIAIILSVFGVLIYHYKSENPVVKAVASVIHFPVEEVNGRFVSYHEYLFELGTVKQYYSNQTNSSGAAAINFNTADGKAKLVTLKKQIMTQLKTDAVTRQLIAQNNIKVSAAQINSELAQLTQQAGGTDKLKGVLTKDYGWTVNDLKAKLKFQLAQQQLSDKITSDPTAMAQAKAKAQMVLDKVNAGGDFAALAKQYSQDSSASNGGDLGTFAKGSGLDTNLETAAFKLSAGQVSGLIKVAGGYSIIKVIDTPTPQVHAAEIFIKSVDFTKYLNDKINAAKVHIYFTA